MAGVAAQARMERMRVAVGQVSVLTDEILTFARQLGVSGMQVNTPALPGRIAGNMRTCERSGIAVRGTGCGSRRLRMSTSIFTTR